MNKWIERDLKYNWHPYTQMKECEGLPPILIEKAKGIKLYDIKGNFYYDTISSWWCNIHGHNHPKIMSAIRDQLKKLDHVLFAGFTHKPAIRLAEKLIQISPKSLNRVFFSDNGSTAVEAALKISLQYWNNIGKREKTKFVSLKNAYHGDTAGTMSISDVDKFNRTFSPMLFDSYRADVNSIDSLKSIFKSHSKRIAALIMEPLLQAAGGMIIYPAKYLREAARLAKRYNVLLILDEVATGFGRTGKMFACEHAGVQPDIMCLSKGLTSGTLPLAATLVTEKIYKSFYADYEKNKTFFHGHTYTANPIACSAAIASLDLFKEEETLKQAGVTSSILAKRLEKFKEISIVTAVRSIGLVGAIDLSSTQRHVGLEIYKRGLKNHLLLRPLGNIIYLYLPLCIKPREIHEIIDRTYDILYAVDQL